MNEYSLKFKSYVLSIMTGIGYQSHRRTPNTSAHCVGIGVSKENAMWPSTQWNNTGLTYGADLDLALSPPYVSEVFPCE